MKRIGNKADGRIVWRHVVVVGCVGRRVSVVWIVWIAVEQWTKNMRWDKECNSLAFR